MTHKLKNCRNGETAIYNTTVEIKEEEGMLTFLFTAENTTYYCPCSGYNAIHSRGDAFEILIGSHPERKEYYEIEVSPKNELMIAKMVYGGEDATNDNEPILDMTLIDDCFVSSKVTITENGYNAELCFKKDKVKTGDGEFFFNAYRLETDGEYKSKHLFALNPTMRGRFHVPKYYVALKDYVNK